MFDWVSFFFALLILGGPTASVPEEVGAVTADSDTSACQVSNPIVTGWKDSVVVNNCD
jgi:hypothetical protein